MCTGEISCIYPALSCHVGRANSHRAGIFPGTYFNLTMTAPTPILNPKHVPRALSSSSLSAAAETRAPQRNAENSQEMTQMHFSNSVGGYVGSCRVKSNRSGRR